MVSLDKSSQKSIWKEVFSPWDFVKIIGSIAVIAIVAISFLGFHSVYQASQEKIQTAREEFCWSKGYDKVVIREKGLYCWNTGNGEIWHAEKYLQTYSEQLPGLAVHTPDPD